MPNDRLQDRWDLGNKIGSGGFADVYEARPKSPSDAEIPAVIKLIPKLPGAPRELLFEDLEPAANIVPVIDRGEWEDNWALVMFRADKSLRDYLIEKGGTLEEDEAVIVLRDIVTGLSSLEGSIVHRDLKPDNVLLWNGNWCLADFGIARYSEATTEPDTRKFAWTPPYAAPEQWRHQRAQSATDVYAVGIIAFEILTGRTPFSGPQIDDFRSQHLQDTPPRISEIQLGLDQLIAECLYKAPEARPTPQNILARLENAQTSMSSAAKRLQTAFDRQVSIASEHDRQASLERTETERRNELVIVASAALAGIATQIQSQIEAAAPGSSRGSVLPISAALGGTVLKIDAVNRVKFPSTELRYSAAFDVIAYSQISLQIPQDQWGYEGRSHSLWYCDAKDAGVYRWYETAFMITPLINRRSRMDPFAFDPGDDAFGALSTVMTEYQVAWPFTSIDQGSEEEFFNRWIEWMAAAADGELHHPSSMPERDPKNSWRR